MGQIQTLLYKRTKSKWEINIDSMTLIGKYFKTNKDYVNVMKVNKKYQDFVDQFEVYPLIDYSLTKEKWELMIDSMMIVGKYFETNNDFINMMKVTKKYHDLVKMYHFNPIDECELFENMESQYFYKPQDRTTKKNDMQQYVYWYNPGRELKENEIDKANPHKYIVNNIPKLEEWSGKKYS